MSETTDNTEGLEPQGGLYVPPDELFANKRRLSRSERPVIEDAIFIFDRLEYTPEGRPLTWLQYFKRPRKGILSPELMGDLNLAKMSLMSYMSVFSVPGAWTIGIGPLFLPWNRKIKIIEGMLNGWCRQMDWIMDEWYMEPHRYQLLCQELAKFIETFMVRLGFSQAISQRVARAVVTMIEYDSQYHYRIKDVFYQLESVDAMVRDPEAEILRLAAVLKAREKIIYDKFDQFVKLTLLLLKIPRVKRAFKETFAEVNVSNLWPDADDAYWMLRNSDYDYDGVPFAERWKKFELIHTNPKTGEVELPKMMKVITVYDKQEKNEKH